MQAYLSEKLKDTSLPTQPYLLVLCDSDSAVEQVYIVLEYSAVHAPNVKKGFDLLYKCFYVFNVEYPFPLEPVYSFVDLLHNESAKALKSVREKFNFMYK